MTDIKGPIQDKKQRNQKGKQQQQQQEGDKQGESKSEQVVKKPEEAPVSFSTSLNLLSSLPTSKVHPFKLGTRTTLMERHDLFFFRTLTHSRQTNRILPIPPLRIPLPPPRSETYERNSRNPSITNVRVVPDRGQEFEREIPSVDQTTFWWEVGECS